MKALWILAALALIGQTTQTPAPAPRVMMYALLSPDGGRTWTHKEYALDGVTVDTSVNPPVMRFAPSAPAKVKWSDIEGAPKYQFLGPWVTSHLAKDNTYIIGLSPKVKCTADLTP